MIDDKMCAERPNPLDRLGPRGGGDDGDIGQDACKLDGDRADATCAADDEERPGRTGHTPIHV
ncbi:hypothetical protein OKW40_004864 [Paraburkholderia sp. RAU6.4a]|uniref:hypothetical protein n=1 Tax=unclassified Paraburkholderia TaxID=2615204 RepID=UPI0016082A8E|nr:MULTISPECIES: hypothetical protein [unclassified Paraburkholderia]MBB5411285.1 hypothetical protein [Paraburkholderia sp. HC6.4b]MBB5456101.1 hypothetical protein [Paraburkholderia sp. Kb1A]